MSTDGDHPPTHEDDLLTRHAALMTVLRQLTMQHRLADAAAHNRDDAVVVARTFGASWTQVGEACEMTRQTAHRRFAHLDPTQDAPPPHASG